MANDILKRLILTAILSERSNGKGNTPVTSAAGDYIAETITNGAKAARFITRAALADHRLRAS